MNATRPNTGLSKVGSIKSLSESPLASDEATGSCPSVTGNTLNSIDYLNGTWLFTHDNVNRISTGTATAGVWNKLTLAWMYDSFGNRTKQTPGGTPTAPVPQPQSFSYPSHNQIANYGAGSYDAAGNVLYDQINHYLYDAEGRVCAVSYYNGTMTAYIEYIYDAEGRRVAKGSTTSFSCNPASNGFALTDQYILGLSGEAVSEQDGSGNFLRSNAYANGELLATYSNNSTYFALNDWLGSKRVVTNPDGTVAEMCMNLPFGDDLICSGSDPSAHHFTGQLHDQESGNDYFGARYYANSTGRFLSPDDDSGQNALSPQSWNLYSYVQNNPLTNTDPDGHDCVTQSRVNGTTEAVSVSSGACTGASGNGTTQTFVNGSVNLSDIHSGADGHSIDIGFTSADGSAGVQNANAAPYADNPGISLGNNQAGMFQMSGTNRVVNQIGGAIFGAETAFMGSLLGDTVPTAMLSGGSRMGAEANAAATAERISNGHAFGKHAAEFGNISRNDFTAMVKDTIANPSETRSLSNGRTAFWSDSEQMVVIKNPGAADGGTAFRPTGGKAYFDNLR